ncbi:MAG: DUF6464 family protein [Cyanobacteriota bacterium]
MELDLLPTEIIITDTRQSLGKIQLESKPQPGQHLEVNGTTYRILERHHHYQYRGGGYKLDKMSVYVQSAQPPEEATYLEGKWVIGDITCQYNARSELLRCAVNPNGPCQGCQFYEPIQD